MTNLPPFRPLAAAGLAIAVYGMQATLLGTLLPRLSHTFTPGQSGTLAVTQSAGLIAASLATGPFIDRTGAKGGVLTGLLLIALAMTMLPLAVGYGPVLLVLGLLGLGGGVIATSTNTMATDLGGDNPAPVVNLVNVFFGLGGLATPALATFLPTGTLCLVIALLAVAAGAVHLSLPAKPAPAGGRGFRGAAEFRLLLRPLFLLLALFLLLYVAAEVGIWNWLAVYLTERGLSETEALRVISFGFAAGIIAGRIAASRVLSRFRPATVTLGCSLLMMLSTLALLRMQGALAAGAVVFLVGFVMAPVYPTTLSMVSQAFPRGTATAIGIAVTMGWAGVALSSAMIGGIAGADPRRLGQALLVIPACSAAMLLVNLMFRRMLRDAGPDARPPVAS